MQPASADWKWEVNLIGSRQINAFCMPGGKIAFYYGILSELQLSDDEVAMIMGHEAAHALLEHAREQMGKNVVTTGGAAPGCGAAGPGQPGRRGGAGRRPAAVAEVQPRRRDPKPTRWAW
jgi:Zn-dependent protease with chaperone function